jgi:hypothetical protein
MSLFPPALISPKSATKAKALANGRYCAHSGRTPRRRAQRPNRACRPSLDQRPPTPPLRGPAIRPWGQALRSEARFLQKPLAFRSKGSIGVVIRRRAVSVSRPTAPSAFADPGLVLVRGLDRSGFEDEGKGWIMTVKLTDAQLVTLSAAAQRADLCLTASDRLKGAVLAKVGGKLVKLGLAKRFEPRRGRPSGAETTPGRATRSN